MYCGPSAWHPVRPFLIKPDMLSADRPTVKVPVPKSEFNGEHNENTEGELPLPVTLVRIPAEDQGKRKEPQEGSRV